MSEAAVLDNGFINQGTRSKSVAKSVSSVVPSCQNNNGKILLDFEGLGNAQTITSSAYQACGVSFSSNALSLIEQTAGGTGNFANEPSPSTVLFFNNNSGGLNSTRLNISTGITGGFSFYYCSFVSGGYINVYSGTDASGSVLTTLSLPTTTSSPNGVCNTWKNIGVSFNGIGKSIVFGGVDNQIGFDNITLNTSVASSSVSGSGSVPTYSTSTTNSLTGAGSLAPTANNPSFIADPVNAATGSHVLERNLISISGLQPINLTARYDSLLLAVGPMGIGWGHNFEAWLEVLATANNNVRIHWDANHSNTFANDGSNNFSSADLANIAIKFDHLVKNSNSSYTLTRKDGGVLSFDSSGKLIQQKNRIGQSINLAYDSNSRLSTITEPISGAALTFTYTVAGLIDHVTDPLSRQVKFTYDGSSNLTTITDPNNKATIYTYNADGRVLTGVAAEGNTIFTNIFDSQGRISTQKDALAATTTFSYDETTQTGHVITTVTNRTGATRVLTHDSSYNLLNIKDELNNTTIYTYDSNGNRLTATDTKNNTTTYTYDVRGNILTVTDPKNRVTTMTYDASDNLLTVTNSTGKKVTYTYDTNNRVSSVKDPLNRITSYTYNANGQVATVTDAKGCVTTNTYSGGLLHSVTDPAGNSTSYAYDSAGRVVSTTNPAGKTSTIKYDSVDNLVSITDPLNHSASSTYDSHRNRLTSTDAKGNVTTYAYNGNGKITSIKNALNQITTFTYDAEDRPTKVTDARGNSITTGYDVAGRPVSVTDALSNSVATSYDAVGNVISRTDAYNSAILTMTYDSKSYKPLTIKDALLNTVTYGYDTLDRVTSVLDPLSRNQKGSYDDLNRLISAIDPKNGTVAQTFDANGNRISQSDPNNNQTSFAYDTANRLTTITSASGGARSLTYNSGQLATVGNARSQTATYTYYDDGRVKTITDPVGTITYTYDANGNVLTVVEGSKTLTYQYDVLNRVTSYTDGSGNVIQYAFDTVGNLTTMTYPDGKVVTYVYDAANRLTKVTDWASRVTSYTYDKNGRLLTATRPDGSVEARTYNAAGQLTQIKDTKADGTTLINKYTFIYDAAGNVTSEINTGGDPDNTLTSAAMTYGADNQLATFQGSAVSYDADGNMTSGPLGGTMQAFTYDSRNRLTAAGGTTYVYDANNIRGAVTTAVQTTNYVINPIASLSQVLMEKDGSGSVKAWYVYGLGMIGRQDATGNSYKIYHYDRRGSTVALTDTTGAITGTYSYAPYGELLSQLGTTPNPFLYNGRDGVVTDANGLYLLRARYYNPTTKRFINMDALLGGIDDGSSLNRYAYVNGSPVNGIDPNGSFAIVDDIVVSAVGAVAGLGGQAIGDVIAWNGVSDWETYAGATVGGAAGAEIGYLSSAVLTPIGGAVVVGAVDSGVSELTIQALHKLTNNQSFNATALVEQTLIGGVLGPVGEYIPKIPGITSGRNSAEAVFKSGVTKLSNNTGKMSANTFAKGLLSQVPGLVVSGALNSLNNKLPSK
jgi:RHS repeat-associated protein